MGEVLAGDRSLARELTEPLQDVALIVFGSCVPQVVAFAVARLGQSRAVLASARKTRLKSEEGDGWESGRWLHKKHVIH